jgi:hypothetical protein
MQIRGFGEVLCSWYYLLIERQGQMRSFHSLSALFFLSSSISGEHQLLL